MPELECNQVPVEKAASNKSSNDKSADKAGVPWLKYGALALLALAIIAIILYYVKSSKSKKAVGNITGNQKGSSASAERIKSLEEDFLLLDEAKKNQEEAIEDMAGSIAALKDKVASLENHIAGQVDIAQVKS